MPSSSTDRSSLLRYWTLRYVFLLSTGLLLIGVASVLWIRHSAVKDRLESVQSFSQEAAAYVVDDSGQIRIPDSFYMWIDGTQRKYRLPAQFGLTVFDQAGKAVFTKKAPSPAGSRPRGGSRPQPPPERQPAHESPDFPESPPLHNQITVARDDHAYGIAAPIHGGGELIGMLAISYSKQELADTRQPYGLITSLLLLSGLLGWLIIYVLLRQLTKPIYQVVNAFKRIETGDYTLLQEDKAREQEMHDLLVYFNSMSTRLQQLEQLRAELLAGVTHELRTPITSIRGLTTAVRDQVVESQQADEFLDISLRETKRLELLVSDLLDFNSFASGNMRLQVEQVDIPQLLDRIVVQWKALDPNRPGHTAVQLHGSEGGRIVCADADRIQQILFNLWNNSSQAMGSQGVITVTVRSFSAAYEEILVTDNGPGIPDDEQLHLFDPYFRGADKKRAAVHGLGLGLTISRMLAHAMGGSLLLKESSPSGTTFQLLLPLDAEQRQKNLAI